MIIFLDVNNKKAILYTNEGSKIIDFANINILKTLAEEEILYVTSAVSTNAEEIINTVVSIDPSLNYISSETAKEEYDEANNDNLYLHAKSKKPDGKPTGAVNIPNLKDFNSSTEENPVLISLTFASQFDGYQLSWLDNRFGKDFINSNETIKSLIKNGILEVITGRQLAVIREDYKNKLGQERKRHDDQILVSSETSAKKARTLPSSAEGQSAQEIDVSENTSFKRGSSDEDNDAMAVQRQISKGINRSKTIVVKKETASIQKRLKNSKVSESSGAINPGEAESSIHPDFEKSASSTMENFLKEKGLLED